LTGVDSATDFIATLSASGLGLGAALALSTLVSEDLACIAAGVLAARGAIGLPAAILACLLGIFVGDLLLYLAGRTLGRAAVARRPLRWLVTPAALERGAAWFERRGSATLVAARFLPGSRLATYVAAGVLRYPAGLFALWLLLAGAVWTPLLVGLSAALGAAAGRLLERYDRYALLAVAGIVVAVALVTRVLVPLATWRGRRLLLGRWRRWTRWEFWPVWLFEVPVVLYVLALGLRHRSLTLFTAANPAIPAGGFLGESKSRILAGVAAGSPERVARFARIDAGGDAEGRRERARRFMVEEGLDFPVVVKPDVGQRGAGVRVVRSEEDLDAALAGGAARDLVVQEYVPGVELGVFYVRRPSEERGRIFSITGKELVGVVGDGRRSLEELILADERAVCMAPTFLARHAGRLAEVPAAGERVELVEIGNHCQGALFTDAGAVKTPELEAAVERLSRGFSGFYFGRYDLRAPTLDDFRAGRGFKVLELNGVTSEATSIYDPSAGLFAGYRTLFAQWRLAFAVGAENVRAGARPTPVGEVVRSLFGKPVGGER
jgi:membrane protein DedA with SNARE-associated domain